MKINNLIVSYKFLFSFFYILLKFIKFIFTKITKSFIFVHINISNINIIKSLILLT